eukprot:TRINITY_DN614_c0_g1_i1.p1 TRINITY_DN614_c0_g1~~TRINITY_DN614_c0_g1_i1.p1  ORF type:complete len:582 (-),score=211.39 TRINITY_DN614_c0_g1_i1:346-2091(-)
MSVVASKTAWDDIYSQMLDGPNDFDDDGEFLHDLENSPLFDSTSTSPTLLNYDISPSSDEVEYYSLDSSFLRDEFDFSAIYFPPETSVLPLKRKFPVSPHDIEPPAKRRKTLSPTPSSHMLDNNSNNSSNGNHQKRQGPKSLPKGHGGVKYDEDLTEIEAKIEEIEERKKAISTLLSTAASPNKQRTASFSFPFPYNSLPSPPSPSLSSSSSSSSSSTSSSPEFYGSFDGSALYNSPINKNASLPNLPIYPTESLFADAISCDVSLSLPSSPSEDLHIKPAVRSASEDANSQPSSALALDAVSLTVSSTSTLSVQATKSRLQTRFDVHYAISKLLRDDHLEGVLSILTKSLDSANGGAGVPDEDSEFEFDIFELTESVYTELKAFVETCLHDQLSPLATESDDDLNIDDEHSSPSLSVMDDVNSNPTAHTLPLSSSSSSSSSHHVHSKPSSSSVPKKQPASATTKPTRKRTTSPSTVVSGPTTGSTRQKRQPATSQSQIPPKRKPSSKSKTNSTSSLNTPALNNHSSSTLLNGVPATAYHPSPVPNRHIQDPSTLSHIFQREEVLKLVRNEDEEDEFVDVL